MDVAEADERLCTICGAELMGMSELLRGTCLKCMNRDLPPTCQTHAP